MPLHRCRVVWGGISGAPGVSTFFFDDAPSAIAGLRTFFDSLKALHPTGVTWQVENQGDVLNPANGDLIGGWVGGAQALVTATAAATYSAPTGYVVRWATGAIHNQHRVEGRTYLVPATSSVFQTDGTIDSGKMTTITTAAAALVVASANNLQVWSRPRQARPAWSDKYGKSHPAVTAADGAQFTVNAVNMRDKAAVLTSRRD